MSKIHSRAFHGGSQRDIAFRALMSALRRLRPEQLDVPAGVPQAGASESGPR
jgi:hypothetical protein